MRTSIYKTLQKTMHANRKEKNRLQQQLLVYLAASILVK